MAQNDQGKWFARLDWADDDKFENFGAKKSVNRQVNASDNCNRSDSVQAMKKGKGHLLKHLSATEKRKTSLPKTILTKMAEDSRKALEDNFDQTAIRSEIVKKKSMFKSNFRL